MTIDKVGSRSNPKAGSVPRLLSIGSVAAILDVSPKTVRRRIDVGELPVHRFGRQLRISEADLALFIARSRCISPGKPE